MNLDSVPLWCALFFLYLNFINASEKRCVLFVPYLRVEQYQDSFYQTYIFTSHWSLQDHVSGFWKSELYQQKWKQKFDLFLQYLNFINESGTESRVFLTYQNYYKFLIPTRSCLWFSKIIQRCDQLFPYLNLLKKSGKRGDLFVPFLKLY